MPHSTSINTNLSQKIIIALQGYVCNIGKRTKQMSFVALAPHKHKPKDVPRCGSEFTKKAAILQGGSEVFVLLDELKIYASD
jgi:hypothetical protein